MGRRTTVTHALDDLWATLEAAHVDEDEGVGAAVDGLIETRPSMRSVLAIDALISAVARAIREGGQS